MGVQATEAVCGACLEPLVLHMTPGVSAHTSRATPYPSGVAAWLTCRLTFFGSCCVMLCRGFELQAVALLQLCVVGCLM